MDEIFIIFDVRVSKSCSFDSETFLSNEGKMLGASYVLDYDNEEGKFLTLAVHLQKENYVPVTNTRSFCKTTQVQKLNF
jgi:hypothetical protein